MATPRSFPPDHWETPANGGISGGGGNRTREGFPTEKSGLDFAWACSLYPTDLSELVYCWVYFIGSDAEGDAGELIKIGEAGNPDTRLGGMQTGSPVKLHLLAALPGDCLLEDHIHTVFARDRVRGEWFRNSPALQGLIEVGREAAGWAKNVRLEAHVAEQVDRIALLDSPEHLARMAAISRRMGELRAAAAKSSAVIEANPPPTRRAEQSDA